MNPKRDRIEALTANFQGRDLPAHYLGYFECFNRQCFFEAHEVLEELWLTERGGPRDLFYKALIQLAGAFVHLQKNRPRPAGALLRLAQANLELYPSVYERLDLTQVRQLIGEWLRRLEAGQGSQVPTAPGSSGLSLAGSGGVAPAGRATSSTGTSGEPAGDARAFRGAAPERPLAGWPPKLFLAEKWN